MTTNALTVLDAEEVIEQPQAPMTLFGTHDPVAIVDRASGIARSLADVIRERHLFSTIGGRAHVQVEGWTLLGSMLGVFAEVEWTHPIEGGWEARAVARTLNGSVVGAAEAMCTRSERTWKQRDDYAIRSMAQTRAVSKALRLPLGYIIELAGYSATPAEELNDEQAPGEREGRTTSSAGGKASGASATTPAPATPRDRMLEVARQNHIGAADLEKMAALVGVPANTKANDEQIEAIIRLIETGETERPNDTAADPVVGTTDAAQEAPRAVGASTTSTAVPTSGALPSDAAVTEAAGDGVPPVDASAASEPPQPGTDEYRALEPREKAKARAYWSEGGSPQTVDAPEVAEPLEMAL